MGEVKGAQELNKNLKENLSLESWVLFVLLPWLTCSYCSGLQNNWTKKLVFGRQANVATLLFALLCRVALNENHKKTYVGPLTHGTVRRQTCYVYCVCCVLLCACGGRAGVCNTRGWNQTHGLFLVLVWPWRGAAHGRPNQTTWLLTSNSGSFYSKVHLLYIKMIGNARTIR